jgi:hypothetical protein
MRGTDAPSPHPPVMAGLDPAIHAIDRAALRPVRPTNATGMGRRAQPGDDEEEHPRLNAGNMDFCRRAVRDSFPPVQAQPSG